MCIQLYSVGSVQTPDDENTIVDIPTCLFLLNMFESKKLIPSINEANFRQRISRSAEMDSLLCENKIE